MERGVCRKNWNVEFFEKKYKGGGWVLKDFFFVFAIAKNMYDGGGGGGISRKNSSQFLRLIVDFEKLFRFLP